MEDDTRTQLEEMRKTVEEAFAAMEIITGSLFIMFSSRIDNYEKERLLTLALLPSSGISLKDVEKLSQALEFNLENATVAANDYLEARARFKIAKMVLAGEDPHNAALILSAEDKELKELAKIVISGGNIQEFLAIKKTQKH